MARPDVDLVQLRLAREVDAAGGHEAQRALDLARDLLVAAPLGRARHELLVPLVHARDVGEAALRERAQQVERARRLVVGAQHALRIGHARLGRGRVVVDEVAVEGGQVDVADALGGRRARLCELARDAADLDHRQRRRVGQDDRHLQQDLELLADRHRGGVVERFGAVTGLEQEGAAGRDLRERVPQRARLAGEHERRHPAQLLARDLGAAGVGPHGLLQRLVRAPGGGCPGGFRDCHAGTSLRRAGGSGSPSRARARARWAARARPRAASSSPAVERAEAALLRVHSAEAARVVAERPQAAGQPLVAEQRREAPVRRGPGEVQLARDGPAPGSSPSTSATSTPAWPARRRRAAPSSVTRRAGLDGCRRAPARRRRRPPRGPRARVPRRCGACRGRPARGSG